MELLLIAARNILRNKRRTLLNLIALGIGTTVMIFGIGWIRGYIGGIYERMIAFETGHLQILHTDYQAESRRMPLNLNIQDPASMIEGLEDIEGVVETAPRIDFTAKLSFSGRSVQLLARGIDFPREALITEIDDNIVQGSFSEGLLIGRTMAEKMGAEVGDTVFLSSQDRYQNQNLIDITLTGIFDFGYAALDENMIYLPLETADSLLGMGGEITRLVVRLERTALLESLLPEIERIAGEWGLAAESWREFAGVMITAIEADIGGFYFMLAIIYLLVLLGILNSMSMSVEERVKEIGTLRAIGMKKRVLRRMFILEGISTGILSGLAGMLLALPIVIYLQRVGFDMAGMLPEDIPIPFGSVLTGDYRIQDFLLSGLITTIAATLGSLIPAFRAGRKTIAETFSALAG